MQGKCLEHLILCFYLVLRRNSKRNVFARVVIFHPFDAHKHLQAFEELIVYLNRSNFYHGFYNTLGIFRQIIKLLVSGKYLKKRKY